MRPSKLKGLHSRNDSCDKIGMYRLSTLNTYDLNNTTTPISRFQEFNLKEEIK